MPLTISSLVVDTGVDTDTYYASNKSAADRAPPNALMVPVDFGTAASDMAVTTVTGALWARSRGPRPMAVVVGREDADDDEDALIEGITAVITNIVDGVSFDVVAHAPHSTGGVYLVQVIGAEYVR